MQYKNLASGAAAALLLTVVWGCGRFVSSSQNGSSAPSGSPATLSPTTSGDVTSSGDPRSDLIAALKNRDTAPSYRMEGSVSQSDGRSISIIMEFQAPDRIHVIRTGQVGGLGSQKGETISIGTETWLKREDGPWKKSPININVAGTIFDDKKLEELAKENSAEVKYLGNESLNGSEMKVYQFSDEKKDEDTGEITKLTGKYWIGVADKRPHKMEGQSETNEAGKEVTSKESGTFDYDAAVKIDPPM